METQIVGRITRNAEVKQTQNGKEVVNFSIAENNRYTVKATGEKKDKTTYVDCAVWNRAALAPFLKKGALVELRGEVGVDAYTNTSGDVIGKLTLRVYNVKFHGGKKEDGATAANTAAEPVAATEVPADDLPF
jgi:single-strand DNA-binding protein